MKLNLGSGPDVQNGYINVDFRELPGVDVVTDLSKFSWQWKDDSVDEVKMLDFLEHFSYRLTDKILAECWRVLKVDGELIIQVPDFSECARAALQIRPYDCNKCGYEFHDFLSSLDDPKGERFHSEKNGCPDCKQTHHEIAQAGLMRLYGGQEEKDNGNWHFMAFTKQTIKEYLDKAGFSEYKFLEIEHQKKNWNFKISCKKVVQW